MWCECHVGQPYPEPLTTKVNSAPLLSLVIIKIATLRIPYHLVWTGIVTVDAAQHVAMMAILTRISKFRGIFEYQHRLSSKCPVNIMT